MSHSARALLAFALLTATACDAPPEDLDAYGETGDLDLADAPETPEAPPENGNGRGPWRPCGDLDPCMEGWRCAGPSHPDTPLVCVPDVPGAASCHDQPAPIQPDPTGLINVTCEAGSPHWQIRAPHWALEASGGAADPCTSFGAGYHADSHIFPGTFCRP